MRDGFIKVGAAAPFVRVADVAHNTTELIRIAGQAARAGCKLLCFPELSLTGATCGDLFYQDALLCAAEQGLERLCSETAGLDMLLFVGLPVRAQGKLYNGYAALLRGSLLAVYAKACPAGWDNAPFASADHSVRTIRIAGQEVPFGRDMLLCCESLPALCIAAVLADDALSPISSGHLLALAGATVLAVGDARHLIAGAHDELACALSALSARLYCGCVYINAGEGESTTDGAFGGNGAIFEAGETLCVREPFACKELVITELDVGSIQALRRRSDAFPPCEREGCEEIRFTLDIAETELTRSIDRDPFYRGVQHCRETLELSARALAGRLSYTRCATAVIGISGGLDSTLALLTCARAFDICKRPRSGIIAVTMPCFGTGERTRTNADKLCAALGVELRCVNITRAVLGHFSDIGQDPESTDVTFENSQARERTQILMDLANREGGMVIGTGDLSELALGFATYNGDHMSMYGVNASIPKTLIRHVVSQYADDCGNAALADVLRDILDTPVSPELLPAKQGEIVQRTEDILGDYILQDFFLYHVICRCCPPRKLVRLAQTAFADAYTAEYIREKLGIFYRRFFSQQFKRSCLPDGPAVGPVSLSPRGAWHMPSDACARVWLEELEQL